MPDGTTKTEFDDLRGWEQYLLRESDRLEKDQKDRIRVALDRRWTAYSGTVGGKRRIAQQEDVRIQSWGRWLEKRNAKRTVAGTAGQEDTEFQRIAAALSRDRGRQAALLAEADEQERLEKRQSDYMNRIADARKRVSGNPTEYLKPFIPLGPPSAHAWGSPESVREASRAPAYDKPTPEQATELIASIGRKAVEEDRELTDQELLAQAAGLELGGTPYTRPYTFETQQEVSDSYQQAIAAVQREADAIKARGATWTESFSTQDWFDRFQPFIGSGSVQELDNDALLKKHLGNLQAWEKSLAPHDPEARYEAQAFVSRRLMRDMQKMAGGDADVWERFKDMVSHLPRYAIEFVTAGLLAKAVGGSLGATRALGALEAAMLRAGVPSLLAGATAGTARFAGVAALGAATVTAESTLAKQRERLRGEITIDRRGIPQYVGPVEGEAEALLWAYSDQVAELFGEQLGGAIGKGLSLLGRGVGRALPKTTKAASRIKDYVSGFVKARPAAAAVLKASGYHGLLNEFGEEIATGLIQSLPPDATHSKSLWVRLGEHLKFLDPTSKEFWATLGTLAVFPLAGAVARAPGGAVRAIRRMDAEQRVEEALQAAPTGAESAPTETPPGAPAAPAPTQAEPELTDETAPPAEAFYGYPEEGVPTYPQERKVLGAEEAARPAAATSEEKGPDGEAPAGIRPRDTEQTGGTGEAPGTQVDDAVSLRTRREEASQREKEVPQGQKEAAPRRDDDVALRDAEQEFIALKQVEGQKLELSRQADQRLAQASGNVGVTREEVRKAEADAAKAKADAVKAKADVDAVNAVIADIRRRREAALKQAARAEKEEAEERLGSVGYTQAKKQPGGGYKLFYTGTRNEPFPGETFRSPREARGYFQAQRIKRGEVAEAKPPSTSVAPPKPETTKTGRMRKDAVKVGETYMAKVSNKNVPIRILNEREDGGWDALNTKTDKKVRIKPGQTLKPLSEKSRAVLAKEEEARKPKPAAAAPKEGIGEKPVGVSPAPSDATEPFGKRRAQPFVTGVPFRRTMFRGQGASKEEVYGHRNVAQGLDFPVLGPATYLAFSERQAKRYGKVSAVEASLNNPLVLTNDKEWQALRDSADVSALGIPGSGLTADQKRSMTERLRAHIISAGYDGVIVDLEADRNNDRLFETFGVSQVVSFGKPAATAAPAEGIGEKPAPAEAEKQGIGEVERGRERLKQLEEELIPRAEAESASAKTNQERLGAFDVLGGYREEAENIQRKFPALTKGYLAHNENFIFYQIGDDVYRAQHSAITDIRTGYLQGRRESSITAFERNRDLIVGKPAGEAGVGLQKQLVKAEADLAKLKAEGASKERIAQAEKGVESVKRMIAELPPETRYSIPLPKGKPAPTIDRKALEALLAKLGVRSEGAKSLIAALPAPKKDSRFEQFKKGMKRWLVGFVRSHEFLRNSVLLDAQVAEILDRLPIQYQVALDTVDRDMRAYDALLKGDPLDAVKFALYWRWGDAREGAQRGEMLPKEFGSLEELDDALKSLLVEIEASPKLLKVIAIRKAFHEKYLEIAIKNGTVPPTARDRTFYVHRVNMQDRKLMDQARRTSTLPPPKRTQGMARRTVEEGEDPTREDDYYADLFYSDQLWMSQTLFDQLRIQAVEDIMAVSSIHEKLAADAKAHNKSAVADYWKSTPELRNVTQLENLLKERAALHGKDAGTRAKRKAVQAEIASVLGVKGKHTWTTTKKGKKQGKPGLHALASSYIAEHHPWRDENIGIGRGIDYLKRLIRSGDLTLPDKDAEIVVSESDLDLPDGIFGIMERLLKIKEPNEFQRQGQIAALSIHKAINARRIKMKEALGDKLVTRKDLIPEGYVEYDTRNTEIWKPTYSVAHHIAEKVLEEGTAEIESKHVKEIKEVFRIQKRYVIPENIAKQLADTDQRSRNRDSRLQKVADVWNMPWSLWKGWLLKNPFTVLSWQIGDVTGNIGTILAANPGLLLNKDAILEAMAVVRDYHIKKQQLPRQYEWLRTYGILRGGLFSYEVGDVSGAEQRLAEVVDHLTALKPRALDAAWQGVGGIVKWYRGYGKFVGATAATQDSFWRVLYALDMKQKSARGEPTYYGGARASTAQALQDSFGDRGTDMMVAHVTRRTFGDPNAMPLTWKELNRGVFWFSSWPVELARRIPNIFWNHYKFFTDHGVSLGNGRYKITGAKAKALGITLATLKMTWGYLLMQLWNNLFFDDEEENMPFAQRARPHLWLWRDRSTGEAYPITDIGALSSFFETFGINTFLNSVLRGDADTGDVIVEIGKDPIQKLAQSLNPALKIPVELITGTSVFPDVTDPRKVDTLDTILNATAIPRYAKSAIASVTGSGEYGYPDLWRIMRVTNVDQHETALNNSYELVRKWSKDDSDLPKSRFAVMRRAALHDDPDAFHEAFTAYQEQATKDEATTGIKTPEKRFDAFDEYLMNRDPLARLSAERQRLFMDSLSERERRIVAQGQEHALEMGYRMAVMFSKEIEKLPAELKAEYQNALGANTASRVETLGRGKPNQQRFGETAKDLDQRVQEWQDRQKNARRWFRLRGIGQEEALRAYRAETSRRHERPSRNVLFYFPRHWKNGN